MAGPLRAAPNTGRELAVGGGRVPRRVRGGRGGLAQGHAAPAAASHPEAARRADARRPGRARRRGERRLLRPAAARRHDAARALQCQVLGNGVHRRGHRPALPERPPPPEPARGGAAAEGRRRAPRPARRPRAVPDPQHPTDRQRPGRGGTAGGGRRSRPAQDLRDRAPAPPPAAAAHRRPPPGRGNRAHPAHRRDHDRPPRAATTPTSPSRGHPGPGRPTSAPASSPAWCSITGGVSE